MAAAVVSQLSAGPAPMGTSLAFRLTFAIFGVGLPLMILVPEGHGPASALDLHPKACDARRASARQTESSVRESRPACSRGAVTAWRP
jgi:hypothetical protein